MGNRADISLHGVTQFRLRYLDPVNSNCLSLEIVQEDGTSTLLTLFGLDDRRSEHVARALSDAFSTVRGPNGMEPALDYFTTEAIIDKMEGRE